MFSAIYQTEHGDTVAVDSVREARMQAYKSAAYIKNILGRQYQLTFHADDCVTLAADGLATITYQPASASVLS